MKYTILKYYCFILMFWLICCYRVSRDVRVSTGQVKTFWETASTDFHKWIVWYFHWFCCKCHVKIELAAQNQKNIAWFKSNERTIARKKITSLFFWRLPSTHQRILPTSLALNHWTLCVCFVSLRTMCVLKLF